MFEIVTFQQRERERVVALIIAGQCFVVREQGGTGPLIQRPPQGRFHLCDFIIAIQAFVIGVQQITAFMFWNDGYEPFPRFRENHAHAIQEPFNLIRFHQEDAAQDKADAAFRMGRGIGHGQGTAP